MRPTPFYLFEYTLPGAQRPKRTTYRMTIEEAAERYPGAVPVEWSREIRNLPDDDDRVNGGLGFLALAPPDLLPCSLPGQLKAGPARRERVAG